MCKQRKKLGQSVEMGWSGKYNAGQKGPNRFQQAVNSSLSFLAVKAKRGIWDIKYIVLAVKEKKNKTDSKRKHNFPKIPELPINENIKSLKVIKLHLFFILFLKIFKYFILKQTIHSFIFFTLASHYQSKWLSS